MKPERWQQIEQLYHAALEREPGQRAAFLAEVCAGDEALRCKVEALLRRDEQAEDFLEAPALAVAAQLHAARQAQSLIGRQLGPYRILSLLGAGGMSEVYLALDARLNRQVALKLLPAHFTQHPDRLRRFTQEAKAASALNHPNIITIHEIGEIDGVYFIATEFIAGQTLRQQMNGPMRLGAALEVARQVASALAVAHVVGIVHRDIKPENIMLRPDGYVKVLDFGIAKLSEPEAPLPEAISTETGMVLGTVRYMSPEQARGLKVDNRSDVFSLGVVLFEMLVGCRPFEGATPTDVLLALVERAPPPLAQYAPSAPGTLQRIVGKALCKDRNARYQTVADLLTDLGNFSRELGEATKSEPLQCATVGSKVVAVTESSQAAVTERPPTLRTAARPAWIKRRQPVMLAGLALLALIILWLGYHFPRSHETALDSLAVLPFTSASDDPEVEMLADGVTAGLIHTLSQLPRLRVIAHGSVAQFKHRQSDPPSIGRRLGVGAVLTGRIVPHGEHLAINTELIAVRDGSHLWGAQYERLRSDILVLQKEINRQITVGLRLELSGAEQERLRKSDTENTEAYRLYLKARYFFFQFKPESMRRALDHFHQAIILDPGYAQAYAGIADVYLLAASQYLAPSEGLPPARQAAMRALELDETLAEAHLALALIRWWADWNWPAAEHEFRRALELSPSFASARAVYSEFLATQERFDEALQQAQRAQESDPLSLHVSSTEGRVLYYARRYDQALTAYRKTLELDPAAARTHRGLGRALAQQGRYEEAIAELQQAAAREQHYYFITDLGYTYALAGRRSAAVKTLRQLQRLAQQSYVSPVYLAKIHAGLGEKERAFEWLDRGYQERSDQLTALRVDPAFDRLRSDARFQDLLRRVGL